MASINNVADRFENYKANIPRFDDWHEAACIGFYGYANGRAASFGHAAVEATGRPQPTPCSSCPEKEKCWAALKAAAAELFPLLVEAFEEMAKEVQGPELVKRWSEKMGKDGEGFADPYIYTSIINMQVGIEHEHAEATKE